MLFHSVLNLDVTQRDIAQSAYNRLLLKFDLVDYESDMAYEDHFQRLDMQTLMAMEKISVGAHGQQVWIDALGFNFLQIKEVLDEMVTMNGALDASEKWDEGKKPIKEKRRARSQGKNYFTSSVETYLCSLFLAVYRYNWPYVGALDVTDMSLALLMEQGKRYVRALEIRATQCKSASI